MNQYRVIIKPSNEEKVDAKIAAKSEKRAVKRLVDTPEFRQFVGQQSQRRLQSPYLENTKKWIIPLVLSSVNQKKNLTGLLSLTQQRCLL